MHPLIVRVPRIKHRLCRHHQGRKRLRGARRAQSSGLSSRLCPKLVNRPSSFIMEERGDDISSGPLPRTPTRCVKAPPQKAENVGRIMRETCARSHPRLDRTCQRDGSSTQPLYKYPQNGHKWQPQQRKKNRAVETRVTASRKETILKTKVSTNQWCRLDLLIFHRSPVELFGFHRQAAALFLFSFLKKKRKLEGFFIDRMKYSTLDIRIN
ncbi:translation initiation factor IF-2 [Dorcoceras hygrometricum]|nr:translation initiation factor IF-2 [Dorcoceras hygrometricum]